MRIDACGTNAGAQGTARNRARKRGSAIIEFAVAAMVFLAFLFGIIDCARAFYAYQFVTYAARSGARWAAVRGTTCPTTNGVTWCGSSNGATTGEVQTYVQGLNLPGIDPSQITVTTSWPSGNGCAGDPNSPGCPVKVVVQYPYLSTIPFFRIATLTLTAQAEMTISD